MTLEPFEPGGHLDPERTFEELLATLTMLMLDVSLLEEGAYLSAMERAFALGLGHKLAIGRPYDEMAEIVPKERWDETQRHAHEPPLGRREEPLEAHRELRWQDGPGPTFSDKKAREMNETRYSTIRDLARVTLPRLQGDPAFLTVVRELRAEGWLDWQLLTAMYNIAYNHRMTQAGLSPGAVIRSANGRRAAHELAFTPEGEEAAEIPLSAFTRDAMALGLRFSVPSTLTHWDLHPRQETPDFEAIQRVLDERYAYHRDDVPHEDPFPRAQGSAPMLASG